MTQDSFSPFDQNFDKPMALAALHRVTDGADDGELYLERNRSEALVYDDQSLKQASYDATEGFGLRAVKGEVLDGFGHSLRAEQTPPLFSLYRATSVAFPAQTLAC